MTLPIVLLENYLGSAWSHNHQRWVLSADTLWGQDPLILRLQKRLRSFGYERFFLQCYVIKQSWIPQDQYDIDVARAHEFLKASGLPGCVDAYDDCDSLDPIEAVSRTALIVDSVKAGDDEIVLSMMTRGLLMSAGELEHLANSVSKEQPVGAVYQGVLPWEHSYALRYGLLRQKRRDGAHIAFNSVDSPARPSSPLPISNRFEPTAMYDEALDALTSRSDCAWSREDLGILFKEKPALFRERYFHVGVELTNEDNLPNRLRSPRKLAPRRATGFMSADDRDAILDSFPGDHRIPASLDLWDFGEPLLHPDAIGFIEKAAARGVRVDLRTNGTLIDDAMAERLVHSGVDAIFVRLDAHSPESAALICGDATAFERSRRGLDALLKAKASSKRKRKQDYGLIPTLAAELTEMKETRENADRFFEMWDHRTRISKEFLQKHFREPSTAELLDELYQAGVPLEYAIHRHDNLYRGAVARPSEEQWTPLFRFPCRQVHDGLYVLWNGDVVPCREDIEAEHVLGHVRENLQTIWKSAKAAEIFAFHDAGCSDQNHFCSACGEWYYPLA